MISKYRNKENKKNHQFYIFRFEIWEFLPYTAQYTQPYNNYRVHRGAFLVKQHSDWESYVSCK